MTKNKTTVELNRAGVGELLKSSELEQGLGQLAQSYASDGWETDTRQMGTRVIASIYTTDYNVAGEELDTHALVGRLKK